MSDPQDKPEKQESLPFPPTPSASTAGRTMQESVYRLRVKTRRLAAGAPNILIVLIDDAGPGLPVTFGGEVRTPTMDRIVREGISYNRFHTTAMCSPTRASLLTGRNHHRVGAGQIAELANDWDGYSGHIPRSRALVADVLKDYGYATGAWGKWHNTPAEETTPTGPFENWPTGLGFEYFYGFLAGEASQYEPNLVRNTTTVPPTKSVEEGYHLSEDLADDAIGWLHRHKAFQPDKPFLMYWASGAIHGPHHIMKEWADKYNGRFADGWDAYRKRVFLRAKEKGWIPANAQLTPRHATMPSWDSIPEDEKEEDWSQSNDLAAGMPEKLARMTEIFLIEAARNKALPIGGGLWIVALHPEMRISPPYTEWTFSGDAVRMPEFCAPALGNRANIVSIDAVIPNGGNGVLHKLGGNSGGLTCFVEDRILCYEYNLFIIQRTKIRAAEQLPTGSVKIEIETQYVIPKPGGSLKVTMKVGGKAVAEVLCRSARRYSSPPMTASTSESPWDRRSRSITATRRRSDSTAGSSRCM